MRASPLGYGSVEGAMRPDQQGGVELARKINAREIVADLRSGMDESELIRKYNLSPSAFKSVLQQVDQERRIRARAIAEDLKQGLSEIEVMKKHQLTGDAFQRIIEVLLEEKFITRSDMEERTKVSQELVIMDLRKGPRYHPKLSVLVCDRRYTLERYELQDISEYGLAIKGMESGVGEVTNITVLGDEFGQVVPFEFQAQCRWTKRDVFDNRSISGFEITSISVENLGLLCKFIAKYTLSLNQGQPL
jgi:uncharacterized protein (DUF433 family)